MPFKPGESGNPKGRPAGSKNKTTKAADEAFERAFQDLQDNETTSLAVWAKDNLTEFYKLYARKLTTHADNKSHVVSESVTEEQARRMAEEYLARASSPSPDSVHGGDEAGLPAGESASTDC